MSSRRSSPRKGRKGLGGAWSKLSSQYKQSSSSPTSPRQSTKPSSSSSSLEDVASSYYSHPFRETSTSNSKVRLQEFQRNRKKEQEMQRQRQRKAQLLHQQQQQQQHLKLQQEPFDSEMQQQSSHRTYQLSSSTGTRIPVTPPVTPSPTATTRTQPLHWDGDKEVAFVPSPHPASSTRSSSSFLNPTIPTTSTPPPKLKPLLKKSKRGLPSSISPLRYAPPQNPSNLYLYKNAASDDDDSWRTDGKKFRRNLLQQDDDNGGSQFVINTHENLVNYFEIAHRVSNFFLFKLESYMSHWCGGLTF